MKKASAKTPAPKAATKKATPKQKAPSSDSLIVAATVTALEKLRLLQADFQLQSEIEWCLGSYHTDGNPVGLFEMTKRAMPILKEALAKKTKGITAKVISDMEKALASQ
jgi:hypothetical protein